MEFQINTSEGGGFQTKFNDYLSLYFMLPVEENGSEKDDIYIDNLARENNQKIEEVAKNMKFSTEPIDCTKEDQDLLASYSNRHIFSRERSAQTAARVAAWDTPSYPPTQVNSNYDGISGNLGFEKVAVPKTELTLFGPNTAPMEEIQPALFGRQKYSFDEKTRTKFPALSPRHIKAPSQPTFNYRTNYKMRTLHTSTTLPRLL